MLLGVLQFSRPPAVDSLSVTEAYHQLVGPKGLVNAVTREVENRAKNHLYDYATYQDLARPLQPSDINATPPLRSAQQSHAMRCLDFGVIVDHGRGYFILNNTSGDRSAISGEAKRQFSKNSKSEDED
jgi:hypothetical protein